MMMFQIPKDHNLLAVFGELALRHEHLNYILRMTIRTFTEVEVKEALDATAFESTSLLRERIRKLAKQRLGEGRTLIKVQALIERCRRATERRNDYVHSVWAQELDGEAIHRDGSNAWQPIPTIDALSELNQELTDLIQELNHARLEGFIFEALSASNRK
jgi:hypothetical protein